MQSSQINNKSNSMYFRIQFLMFEDTENLQTKRRVKVVLLGDRSVGKSCIINRFIHNEFQQTLQPTVGVDFMAKNIKFKGNTYRIQLWDTAGQEKYRSLVKGYIKGANACVFVYDCTSINSYVNLPGWLELFDSAAGLDAYKVIVGNKCDAEFNSQNLQASKKSVKEQHQILKNIPEFVSSAKLGINIHQIFQQIMQNFANRTNKTATNPSINKMLTNITSYSKSTCCQ